MDIQFFDCNVRLGKASNPAHSKASTVSEILTEMNRCGIEKALAFHKEALNDPRSGNELLIREIAGCPRLAGCAAIAPAWSGEFGDIGRYFSYLRASGIRAVRLFPRIHNFPLEAFCLDSVLEEARRRGMPVLIDEVGVNEAPVSTWNHTPDFGAIHALAAEFPGVNFIVVVPGMQTQRMAFTMMARRPNVFFECSSFGYRNIEYVCERFGAEKLVFGTYFPILEPGAFVSYVMYADIRDVDREKIASRNLERLLGGEPG